MKNKKLLESICSEECSESHCFLKELVLKAPISDRLVEQLAVVHKYKYIRSCCVGKDIGWEQALEEWGELGYAKKFDEVYSPDKTHRQIYKEVMGL